jgi:hypothetical protein
VKLTARPVCANRKKTQRYLMISDDTNLVFEFIIIASE